MSTEKDSERFKAALERIDQLAEAGICQFTAGGKHEFLKDIRAEVQKLGLQGGLTEFKR